MPDRRRNKIKKKDCNCKERKSHKEGKLIHREGSRKEVMTVMTEIDKGERKGVLHKGDGEEKAIKKKERRKK